MMHWSDLLNKASKFNIFNLLKAMLCLLDYCIKKINNKYAGNLK